MGDVNIGFDDHRKLQVDVNKPQPEASLTPEPAKPVPDVPTPVPTPSPQPQITIANQPMQSQISFKSDVTITSSGVVVSQPEAVVTQSPTPGPAAAPREWNSGLDSFCDDCHICCCSFFCFRCYAMHFVRTSMKESCMVPLCVPGWLIVMRSKTRAEQNIRIITKGFRDERLLRRLVVSILCPVSTGQGVPNFEAKVTGTVPEANKTMFRLFIE
ncbi:uncharacterized protein LOC131933494 [Physella acuta]|uniref:uncharacterized protein LOC131933494 n=1 Tax=Physella acuta TaxID=109671 RepID=UPI0027DD1AFA|nr:uncharacterized protein LOC131933494 [Physella acuta]